MNNQDLTDTGVARPFIEGNALPLRSPMVKVSVLFVVAALVISCSGETLPEIAAETPIGISTSKNSPAPTSGAGEFILPTATRSTTTPLPTLAPPLPTPTPSPSPTVEPSPTPTLFIPTLTATPMVATSTPTVPPRPAPLDLIVYVQSNGRGHDLAIANSRGVFIRHLHARAASPSWSPDGRQIAFFGEAGFNGLPGPIYAQGSGIWLINPDGGNLRQLLKVEYVESLAWSPDGENIALEYGPPGIAPEIWVISARDGGLISKFAGEQPAWNSRGDQLAIKTCRPGCGIWIVNINGVTGEQKSDNASDGFPAWSPDNRYLVFSSQRDQNAEIYLLNLTNNRLTNLTNSPMTETTPVFSPSGRRIYFRTDQGGGGNHWHISAIGLDGGQVTNHIIDGIGPSDDWGLARPAVIAAR